MLPRLEKITTLTYSFTFEILLQRLQAGLNGMTGVFVAKNVAVDFLTEEENVFHQNVPTLTLDTTNVLARDMKRNSAINNVVQVS